jgi:hypothetical protein
MSPIREPSPSTRILPIPERSQICKATVSYGAAPVCGNANTSPSSSKTTGASCALSGLGSASAVSVRRGKRWAGFEAMAMIRKGQVRKIDGQDIRGQAAFIADLFDRAA